MRVKFPRVEVFSTKQGFCPVCTRRSNRAITFFQTVSPFNKGADGTPKTESQIREELTHKLIAWKKEPVYHARCED